MFCSLTIANAHRHDAQIEVGDLMYLKIQPYRQVSPCTLQEWKLAPRYYGPYEILKRAGAVATSKTPTQTSWPILFYQTTIPKFSAWGQQGASFGRGYWQTSHSFYMCKKQQRARTKGYFASASWPRVMQGCHKSIRHVTR